MLTMLAPMAGYTDRVIRDLCRMHRADIVYGEMINAHTVVRTPEKAQELLGIENETAPRAVQLFGNEPSMLAQAAKILVSWNVQYIDFNAGCPVKKVVAIGAGSALLKNISVLNDCLRSIRNAAPDVHVSVKIRAGWDMHSLVHREIGRIVSGEGLNHITIHARTRADGFSGTPNLRYIQELKEVCSIPVIGNGNILSWRDAETMVTRTGCDGVMIGRGAIGRPWIFAEIAQGNDIEKTHDEIRDMIIAVYHNKIVLHGERTAIVEMRKTVPFFIRGWEHAKHIRMQLNRVCTIKDVEEVLCEV